MSLQLAILHWLERQNRWVHKGEIEIKAIEGFFGGKSYLGETAGRKCRALEKSGLIEKQDKGASLEYRAKVYRVPEPSQYTLPLPKSTKHFIG